MSSIDIISMAIRNLFKRKLRTFLTILGVVVGTAAIVIMISLGIAMNDSFNEQLSMMGDITKISIYNPNYWGGGGSSKNQNDTTITKATINDLKKISGVKAVTPIAQEYWKFQSGRYVASFSVMGIDPAVMADFGYKLGEGRLLDENDTGQMNMVFGANIPMQFYKAGQRMNFYNNYGEQTEAPVDVLTDKIKMSYDYNFGEKNPNASESKTVVKPYDIKVVGLLSEEDENSYTAIMSLEQMEKVQTAQRKFEKSEYGSRGGSNNNNGYEMAYIKCNGINDVKAVTEELKNLGYEVYSPLDSVSSMQEISKSLQMLLGAIGAVSLFIAAIGITNTMIMSIYERTREIGIMKVIGAKLSDIKKLFLLEAVMIGFFGGVFGVVISVVASAILNNVGISFLESMQTVEGSNISTVPIWLCFAALGFSSMVGLVAGYFPARKAMKLSALSALQKE